MRTSICATAVTLVLALAISTCAQADPVPNGHETARATERMVSELVMRDKAQTATDLLKAGDYRSAADGFAAIMADSQFSSAPEDLRYLVMVSNGWAERGLRHYDKAYDFYQQAGTQFPALTDASYWINYAGLALAMKHDETGVEAMTKVATDYPEAASYTSLAFVQQVVWAAQRMKDKAAERRLLEALLAAHYTPDGPEDTADYLWFRLLNIYVDAHEDDKARALLPAFSTWYVILHLRIETRFRSLILADLATNSGHYDLAKTQVRDLEWKRTAYAAHPELMRLAYSYAYHLMAVNRLDEAMQVADDTLARYDADPKSFTDANQYLNWVHDIRSNVLTKLGRSDEAMTEGIKARDVAKALGDDLISQYINLAGLYYTMDQPQKALDALKDLDEAHSTPYGIMSADEVKVCAYVQLNDSVRMKETLDYVRAHADDGFTPYSFAMECAGDVDSLAKTVIARLDNPQTRSEALGDVQTYLALPHPSAIDLKMDSVWEAVMARDDVKQAVARYGVIENVPSFTSNY